MSASSSATDQLGIAATTDRPTQRIGIEVTTEHSCTRELRELHPNDRSSENSKTTIPVSSVVGTVGTSISSLKVLLFGRFAYSYNARALADLWLHSRIRTICAVHNHVGQDDHPPGIMGTPEIRKRRVPQTKANLLI